MILAPRLRKRRPRPTQTRTSAAAAHSNCTGNSPMQPLPIQRVVLAFLALELSAPSRTDGFSCSSSSTAVASIFLGNPIGETMEQQQHEVKTVEIVVRGDGEDGILGQLFGSSRDKFFQDILGKRVAYFPRSEMERDSPVKGIKLSSLYETNDWISLRIRGSREQLDKSTMCYEQMLEYLDGGGSVVIPISPSDYLHELKMNVENELDIADTSMNVYHSGPSAVALNIHYDAYPVIVLQLSGEKEWIIQNDAFGDSIKDVNTWKNITMKEGDVLYIPKGIYHAATTKEGFNSTTHVTIGLLS